MNRRTLRRIAALTLILSATADDWRTDPELVQMTGLPLWQLYRSLRRLRRLGLVETRRRGRRFLSLREHRTVQDGGDDGRVRPTRVRAYDGEVTRWPIER